MADPLSLLRQYYVNKKEIVEKNDMICFGEYCWPKTVKTNYLAYSSSLDGPNKEYYTLECVLFFMKNVHLIHGAYVKLAAKEEIPVVRRPDRKELFAFVCGETMTASSVDKTAPIELPKPWSDINAGASSTAAVLGDGMSGHNDGNKLAPLDEYERAKQLMIARLDGPKIKKLLPPSATISSGDSASIRDAMSDDQIAEFKAKRLAKKRTSIIDADTDLDGGQRGTSGSLSATNAHSVLLQYDSNATRDIISKERVGRNRSTILQSSGKNFQISIFPMLDSIKAREDSDRRKSADPQPTSAPAVQRVVTPPPTTSTASQAQQMSAHKNYNRYDQEMFANNEAIDFGINTTGSYHGIHLKTVADGAVTPNVAATDGDAQTGQHSVNSKPQKRLSRKPIIIIPSTTTSLITMQNARSILQDLKYIDGKSGDKRHENGILIQRRKPDSTTVPYVVTDNPLKLSPQDWERVVAVFVQGREWQFKGWPWAGNPVAIFDRIKAFHLKLDETGLEPNVAKWSVEVIELSHHKPHLDRANLGKFWSLLDSHIAKHKRDTLRY